MAPRTRRGALALALVVTAALGLRLLGLGFGLPAVYNPDEVAIMNRALAFSQGDLNPHNFLYPTFYFYVLFAWEGIGFLAGRVTGLFDSVAAFERAYFVDPSFIFLTGRLLTVICGVLAVWATARLGARLFGRAAGLWAAALLAVAPLAVRDSHYVKHDIPVTLLVVVAHVLLARAALVPPGSARADARRWLSAGGAAGLAMSTHYYAIFLAVPLALAAVYPRRAAPALGPSGRLALAAVAGVLVFFAASPFLLAEPLAALRDVVANREIVVDRATAATGLFGSAGFYLEWMARHAAGAGAFVLAVAGLVLAVRAGWTTSVFTLGFAVPFVLFIANTYPASRYLNPVLPFMAILAGRALAGLAGRGAKAGMAAALLGALAVAEAGSASLRADLFFRQTDTRTLAADWMARELPEGASVLIQPYSVPLRPSREALVEALTVHLGAPERASVRFRRQLAVSPYPSPSYRTIYLGTGGLDVDKIYVSPAEFEAGRGLAPLRERAVTYVVLKRYNVADPALSSLDAALTREARLLATFSPYRAGADPDRTAATAPFLHNTDARIVSVLERPGPAIEIWTIQP